MEISKKQRKLKGKPMDNQKNYLLIIITVCIAGLYGTICPMGGSAESECSKDIQPQWAKLERNEPSYRGIITDNSVTIPVVNIAFSAAAAAGKNVSNAKTTLRGVKTPNDNSNNMIDLNHVRSITVSQNRYTSPIDRGDYVLTTCVLQDGGDHEEQLLFPFNTVISASKVSKEDEEAGKIAQPFLNKAWYLRDLVKIEIDGAAIRPEEKQK